MFDLASKNLGANEKHFKTVQLSSSSNEFTLEDNTFSDITFESFNGDNIIKIGSNAFNITANKIESINCFSCSIEQQPPKYDIQTVFTQMTQLKMLIIGLNVNKIPSNAIANNTKLEVLFLTNGNQNLTIDSGAFHNFENLTAFGIFYTTINRIKKEAFKSSFVKNIIISSCELTGESFENGTFDEIKNDFQITFALTNISYLAESVFKSVLNNSLNFVNFYVEDVDNTTYYSKIDCDDCRNYWLIKENKENQVKEAHCKDNVTLALFDEETKTKLSQKCK